ncbi:MAG: hypothetical protein ACFFB3_17645 [Candidatus Hodarchaeota archaeon]
MENHNHEAEIIAEILNFWQGIPNSPLQEMADNVEIPKAAKLWEKHATFFYQRFTSQPSDSRFQIRWNDNLWKCYRSVWIELAHPGAIRRFQYPIGCFRAQGLSKTFYAEFVSQWTIETEKSLQRFWEVFQMRFWTILADLNSDELACLKIAARSTKDLAVQDFWETDLGFYKYFREKTGYSEDLARIFYRLIAYGILDRRALINFAKIGLAPYLLITSGDLKNFEQDYRFFHVKSSKAKTNFIGLAIPPVAIDLGWKDSWLKENECLEIRFYTYGWNLSQLSTTGWDDLPHSLSASPNEKGLGQITLDFHTIPIELWSSDGLYLERVQFLSPRHLQSEIGKDGQQRLHDLAAMGVIHHTHYFAAVQLADKIVILFCQGSPTDLKPIQNAASHFPFFRILWGTDWMLAVLRMPDAWVSSAKVNLKDLASNLSITNFTLDTDQRLAVENRIHFSKLWDPEKKQWVVWAP